MTKKILVVDDSALMRRVLCDIINSDERFQVVDRAADGLEAFDLLSRNTYDAVILDVNMPKMDGLQLLAELRRYKISARVMVASTDTKEGAQTTLDALELGAMDFIHKPKNAIDCRLDVFKDELLRTLEVLCDGKAPTFESETVTVPVKRSAAKKRGAGKVTVTKSDGEKNPVTKVVALASSTGGPKSLHAVIPKLPADLEAPVLIVQHMPQGFTASLAERLNDLSDIRVKEAEEGEELQNGTVYIAVGGKHLKVRMSVSGKYTLHLSDEPNREGVKPCANYMYESLMDSNLDYVVCVVMTGMGADGTEGITNLKTKRKVHVIAQDQDSSTVFGMPKSVIGAGLSDQVVPLDQIAREIIMQIRADNER